MERRGLFSTIFVATILAVRLLVYAFPLHKLLVAGTVIHHFWIGIVCIALAFLVPRVYQRVRLSMFAVGLGLIADELVYAMFGFGPVSSYWARYSVVGAAVTAVVVLWSGKRILRIIL